MVTHGMQPHPFEATAILLNGDAVCTRCMANCHCESQRDVKAVLIRQQRNDRCSICKATTSFACSDCGLHLCTKCIQAHDCERDAMSTIMKMKEVMSIFMTWKEKMKDWLTKALQSSVILGTFVLFAVVLSFKGVTERGGALLTKVGKLFKEIAGRGAEVLKDINGRFRKKISQYGYASISVLTKKIKEGKVKEEVQRFKEKFQPIAQVLSAVASKVVNLKSRIFKNRFSTPERTREEVNPTTEIRTSALPDFSSRRRVNSPGTVRRSLFGTAALFTIIFLKGCLSAQEQKELANMNTCSSACIGMPTVPTEPFDSNVEKLFGMMIVIGILAIVIIYYTSRKTVLLCSVCEEPFKHVSWSDPSWETMILCPCPGCGAVIHRRCQEDCTCQHQDYGPQGPGQPFWLQPKRPGMLPHVKVRPPKEMVLFILAIMVIPIAVLKVKIPKNGIMVPFAILVIPTTVLLKGCAMSVDAQKIQEGNLSTSYIEEEAGDSEYTSMFTILAIIVGALVILKSLANGLWNTVATRVRIPERYKKALLVIWTNCDIMCQGRCHVGGWTDNQCVRTCRFPLGHGGNHHCERCLEDETNDDLWRAETQVETLKEDLAKTQRDVRKLMRYVINLRDLLVHVRSEEFVHLCKKNKFKKCTGAKGDLIQSLLRFYEVNPTETLSVVPDIQLETVPNELRAMLM